MKKFLTVLIILISVQVSAQTANPLHQNHFSLDFGSYRNRYPFPINNLSYSSSLIAPFQIRFKARLRSYGTWMLYSRIAYDFTPCAEIILPETPEKMFFSAGIGTDIRLRILNDVRSDARSSAEPLITFAVHRVWERLYLCLPLWTRFYSNGISFTVLPEFTFRFNPVWSIFLRYETAFVTEYNHPNHQWQRDCFIGVNFSR